MDLVGGGEGGWFGGGHVERDVCEPNYAMHVRNPAKLLLCRASELEGVFRAPGVLLTTYGMVQHNAELFCSRPDSLYDDDVADEDEERPLWDFLILDEVSGSPSPTLLLHVLSAH